MWEIAEREYSAEGCILWNLPELCKCREENVHKVWKCGFIARKEAVGGSVHVQAGREACKMEARILWKLACMIFVETYALWNCA